MFYHAGHVDPRPVRLIAVGLVWVVAAQVWAALPVAGAMALVGLGATRQLGTRRGGGVSVLVIANGLLYAMLAFVAVGAELHGAVISRWAVTVDAAVAAGIVGVLIAELVREDGAAARGR